METTVLSATWQTLTRWLNHNSLMTASAAGIAVAATGCVWTPMAGAQSAKIQNCNQFTIQDYYAPLSRLGKGRRLPVAAMLPGGPRSVRIRRSGDSLKVGGGQVGFALENAALRRIRGLDLRFSLSLTRIGRGGRQVGQERTRYVRLAGFGRSEQKIIGMRVGGRPAIYRLVVRAANGHTGRHVDYTEFYRAVRPRTNIELAVFPHTAVPGGDVLFRLVNRGTVSLDTGRAFSVEQRSGAGWMVVPSLTSSSVPLDRITVGAGGMLWCERLSLPRETPPGLYRVVKTVNPVFGRAIGRQRPVVSEFSVIGS